jgi:hypothetical protein
MCNALLLLDALVPEHTCKNTDLSNFERNSFTVDLHYAILLGNAKINNLQQVYIEISHVNCQLL